MGKNRRRKADEDSDKPSKKKAKNAAESTNVDPHGDDSLNQVDRSRLEQVQKISSKKEEKRLIVILEGAHLETVKWGKGFGLLNVDDHAGILRKHGREFSSARPDITHQSLLMLMDSPLNRAGLLQVHLVELNLKYHNC